MCLAVPVEKVIRPMLVVYIPVDEGGGLFWLKVVKPLS